MVKSAERDKSNLIIPVAVLAVLIPLLGGGIWFANRGARQPQPAPGPTAEAKSYVPSLKISQVQMRATANYTGAAVVEITGQITNAGSRPLASVELTCIFSDAIGQVVLRERSAIVRSRLNPGETRKFRLPFEGLPASWNQAYPQLVIAQIEFAA